MLEILRYQTEQPLDRKMPSSWTRLELLLEAVAPVRVRDGVYKGAGAGAGAEADRVSLASHLLLQCLLLEQ